MTYADEVLADAPVCYHHLDDVTTTAVDASGNGFNGTYSGIYTQSLPALLPAGVDDSTLFSNGAPDGSVAITNPGGSVTLVSIEAWFRPVGAVGVSEFNCVVQRRNTSAGDWRLEFFGDGSANHKAAFNLRDSGNVVRQSTLFLPGGNEDGWYLVGTYDGANIRIYANAVAGTPFALASSAVTANQNISIATAISRDLYIDEVAYYDTVLSPVRITAHYNAGVGVAGPAVAPDYTWFPKYLVAGRAGRAEKGTV